MADALALKSFLWIIVTIIMPQLHFQLNTLCLKLKTNGNYNRFKLHMSTNKNGQMTAQKSQLFFPFLHVVTC